MVRALKLLSDRKVVQTVEDRALTLDSKREVLECLVALANLYAHQEWRRCLSYLATCGYSSTGSGTERTSTGQALDFEDALAQVQARDQLLLAGSLERSLDRIKQHAGRCQS